MITFRRVTFWSVKALYGQEIDTSHFQFSLCWYSGIICKMRCCAGSFRYFWLHFILFLLLVFQMIQFSWLPTPERGEFTWFSFCGCIFPIICSKIIRKNWNIKTQAHKCKSVTFTFNNLRFAWNSSLLMFCFPCEFNSSTRFA